MGQERSHFGSAHFGRLADIVKEDVAFDPVDVGLLGTDGVVFEADGVANTSTKLSAGLVEQFLGSCFHRFPPLGFDFFRRSLYNLSRSHLPEKGLDRDIIQKTSRNATLEAI